MAKISRKIQKIFGLNAPLNQVGVIGSKSAGAAENSKDPDEMQKLSEYDDGLFAILNSRLPRAEDINGLYYLFSRQLAYLMQDGIPEWDKDQEYYAEAYCKSGDKIYISRSGIDSNPNKDNPPNSDDGTNWEWIFNELKKMIPLSKTFSVGTGGDFSNVTDAFKYLSRYSPDFTENGVKVTLNLLSGFVWGEQLFFRNVNFGWVEIVSEDATVTVQNSKLTETFHGRKPIIGIDGASTGPVLNALLDMDTFGPGQVYDGIVVWGAGSSCEISTGKGVRDAGGFGLYAKLCATVQADGANFSGGQLACVFADDQATVTFALGSAQNGVTHGIRADGGAKIYASGAICTGNGNSGVIADEGAYVSCVGINVSSSVSVGINCTNGSAIVATTANATLCGQNGIASVNGGRVTCTNANARRTLGSDSSADIIISAGALIHANGATGGTNATPNNLTSGGIIFK